MSGLARKESLDILKHVDVDVDGDSEGDLTAQEGHVGNPLNKEELARLNELSALFSGQSGSHILRLVNGAGHVANTITSQEEHKEYLRLRARAEANNQL